MKKFASRFPFLFALAVTAAAMLCLIWPMLWFKGWSITVQVVLSRVTICIFAVVMLVSLGWWRQVGFRKIDGRRTLLPYLPLFILVVLLGTLELITIGVHVADLGTLLIGLAVYLSGGFMEEAVFRGLVLHPLKPGGLLRAAVISSLIFGVVHFINLIGGANLNATVLQVVTAALVGFSFVAPLAVTGNIWPLVVIHFITNFATFLTAGGFLNTAETSQTPGLVEALVSLVPTLLMAAISWWILTRAQKKELVTSQSVAAD